MKLVQTLVVRDEVDIIDAQIAYHLNAGVDFVIATDMNRRTVRPRSSSPTSAVACADPRARRGARERLAHWHGARGGNDTEPTG